MSWTDRIKLSGNKKFEPEFRIPPAADAHRFPTSYHYCSLNTFLSMLQTKSFFLSDINTMNDFSETHWAYDQFINAANKVSEEVGLDFIDKFDQYAHSTQRHILPFICCFSAEGDVLSQWRAYADDGFGIAVGFETASLEKLNVRSVAIDYDLSSQIEHFTSILRATYEVALSLDEEEREDFIAYHARICGVDFACFKNPAFQEEKEIRIIRAIQVQDYDGNTKFIDNGGGRKGGSAKAGKGQPIKFRARDGGIVSYISLPFDELGPGFIKEIVLGPKSVNSGIEVKAALSAAGYPDIPVKKSSATYR